MRIDVTRRSFLAASISAGIASLGSQENLKVGCQANAWPLREGDFDQLINAIETMKRLGYAGFECNIRFVRGQFEQPSEARVKLQSTGMQFIGAHMSMQQASGEDFPKLAHGAAQLGAAYIVMSGSGLSQDGNFTAAAVTAKAAQLEALAGTCRQSGLQLAYHNHTAEFANHNAEMRALAERTNPELVHFLMDAGHGYQGGGDPAAFLLQYSHRVIGCHLKTFRDRTKQVPLGKGDFDFDALAAAIKKTGWNGWLIDEEGGGPSGGNPSAVGPDRDYIRKIFGA